MPAAVPLQPTLWRTCRAIANRNRLRMFGLLVEQPGQTVCEVARCLRLSLPVASLYLRALEARGLLAVRRRSRWVTYRPAAAGNSNSAAVLAAALKVTFQRDPQPVETCFKLATAFTHPRRIELFRALQAGPCPAERLQTATRIPIRALSRHLGKLKARGFVVQRGRLYAVAEQHNVLGRALAGLARQ